MITEATFTLRDLNRQPARILAAVRKFGSAEITTRSGEVFTIAPKVQNEAREKSTEPPEDVVGYFKELWARQRALGYHPPKRVDWDEERFNRIIAGEE